MKKHLSIALTLIVGALGGVAASLVFSRPAEPAARVEKEPRQDDGSVAAALRSNEHRIRVLEQELLQAQKSAQVGAEQDSPTELRAEGEAAEPEPSRMPTDPEEIERMRQEMYQQWEDSLEHHQTQAIAPAFAGPAAQTLSDTLSKASKELGFSLVKVDCRTQSCAATLQYPSYTDAMRDPSRTLILPTDLNCATKIVLPPPQDMNAPYTANVLYDGCKLDSET